MSATRKITCTECGLVVTGGDLLEATILRDQHDAIDHAGVSL